MTSRSSIVLFCTLIAFTSLSAQTTVETVKEGDVQVQITGVSTGMYDGTESESAAKLYSLAGDQNMAGNFDAALKTYKKALKEDPTFVEVYDNMGVIYRRLERYDDAIASYKKSIELYPNGLMAHQNLAGVYHLMGNNDLAINEYTKIVEIDPENGEGYFGLSNLLMISGKLEPALTQAKKALDIYKKEDSPYLSDGYLVVGLIHYYLKDNEAAAPYLEEADRLGAPIDQKIKQEVLGGGVKSGESFRLETDEDYRNSAALLVQAYESLMLTPYNSDPTYEKNVKAFILQWTMGCPEPTMTITDGLMPYMKKSPDLMMIFLGGWATYAVNSNDYDSQLNGALSGTEMVIKYYEANKTAMGKDKSVEKLIKLKEAGELKDYVRKNVEQ